MKPQRNGKLKKGITLLLILAMALSLIVVGSAAPWSNHSTIPTETRNTTSFQVNSVNHTVTFGQTAVWTNKSAGEAAVNLSFDGAEYVMKEIKGYDFALILDTSWSPNYYALRNGTITFVDNMLAQNPDAHFTVVWDNTLLESMNGYTSNRNSIVTWINKNDWLLTNDMVQPACHKAYDMHQATGRDNPLMFVVVGDGDFAYLPMTWTNEFSFEADYHGDHYSVSMSGTPNLDNPYNSSYPSITYGGYTYRDIKFGETWRDSNMTYAILKNGQVLTQGSRLLDACFAQVLYLHKFRNELWGNSVIATICTPYNTGTGSNSYNDNLILQPQTIKARWAADKGYNFEINQNNINGYIAAFAELETTITTRVVEMNTTIDNRYFTVDETVLAAGLPDGYTYDIQNTTRGGVAVQDVQIICQISGEQTLDVSVSIPVTINADIPKSAFLEDDHLPVVYDGTAPNGAAGCLFTDLNSVNQNVNTKQVYIDATDFVPGYSDELFEATAENVILRGDWAEESSGDVVFWVSYDGAPITQDHLDAITFACAPALHWENISREFHTKGTAVLTGVTNGNFAEVKVAVEVKVSGVSAITMDYESTQLAVGYVITPGDVGGTYGTINASDQGALSRVANNVPGTVIPQKGLANNFDYEMMDMTKDNLLNAADVGALSRIVNELAYIYNS